MKNLSQDKEVYKKVRNFFKSQTGRFEKVGTPVYKGKVTIGAVVYSKYELTNSMGQKQYIYESDSPKSNLYDLMLSEVNYE